MPVRQPPGGFDLNSSTGPVQRAANRTARSGGSDFTWPAILACAMLLGFAVSVNFGSAQTIALAADQLHRLLAWRGQSANLEVREALVVTADRRDQLTIVATLSPRGFHPLLASSEREVRSQVRAYPHSLKLAVVDAAMPSYALIVHDLQGAVPKGSIIVLEGSHRSQDTGPMLLDRLRAFERLNPSGARGSARKSGLAMVGY
jgi:hypothetical protein